VSSDEAPLRFRDPDLDDPATVKLPENLSGG
jgi:hypothetical protein